MDKTFRDVSEQYREWASAQSHPTRAIDNGDAHGFALRVMEEALAGKPGGREEIAAFECEYAHLLATTAQTRRERAPWRDYALAVLATVWGALVGEDRHDLTGFLAVVFGVVAVLASLIVMPGVLR